MVDSAMGAEANTGRAKGRTPGISTLKCRDHINDMLSQIASLRGIEKQFVLDEYAATFEADLLKLLASRQKELTKKRG